MKTRKRLSALLLALCLVLSMTVPVAFAAETKTVLYDFDFMSVKSLSKNGNSLLSEDATTALNSNYPDALSWCYKDISVTTRTANDVCFQRTGSSWSNRYGYFMGRAVEGDWIAFTIKNPGAGAWSLYLEHASSYYGASKVNVYILSGTTEKIGEELLGATPVGTYSCYDADITTEKNFDTTTFETEMLGTWTADSDAAEYILVFQAVEANASGKGVESSDTNVKGKKAANIYLTQLTMTSAPVDAVTTNNIGKTTYSTTDEEAVTAITGAVSGDTVQLLADVETQSEIALGEGVKLDLNGQTLTASGVTAFGTGNVIDSSANADGILKVASDKLILQETNPQFPLYDSANGGYKFYTATLKTWEPEGNVYWFRLTFSNSSAYDLIATGTSGLKLGVNMSWTVDGAAGGTTAYLEDNSTIYTRWADAVEANSNAAIKVTVTGTEKVDADSFKLVPVYTSSAITAE